MFCLLKILLKCKWQSPQMCVTHPLVLLSSLTNITTFGYTSSSCGWLSVWLHFIIENKPQFLTHEAMPWVEDRYLLYCNTLAALTLNYIILLKFLPKNSLFFSKNNNNFLWRKMKKYSRIFYSLTWDEIFKIKLIFQQTYMCVCVCRSSHVVVVASRQPHGIGLRSTETKQ